MRRIALAMIQAQFAVTSEAPTPPRMPTTAMAAAPLSRRAEDAGRTPVAHGTEVEPGRRGMSAICEKHYALLGFGETGQHYFEVLRNRPELALAGVVEPDPSRRRLAERNGARGWNSDVNASPNLPGVVSGNT